MKIFSKALWAMTFLLFIHVARADDILIADARKNIPLADDEASFKDYYLSGKDLSGLKKNSLITVVRNITIKDASGSQSLGEISVPVGQLKVISIQGKVAVAREHKLFSRSELPTLEQTGLMIGDRIDLDLKVDDKEKAKK